MAYVQYIYLLALNIKYNSTLVQFLNYTVYSYFGDLEILRVFCCVVWFFLFGSPLSRPEYADTVSIICLLGITQMGQREKHWGIL